MTEVISEVKQICEIPIGWQGNARKTDQQVKRYIAVSFLPL